MKNFFKGIKLRNLIILTAAGIVNAVGVTMFLAPVRLYDSGISGTSMLIWQLTPDYITLSLILLVLNLPLFFIGARRQERSFTVYSVYTIAIYSLSSFMITEVLPIDVSSSSPIVGGDVFLCAVFGGLISGIGSGCTIRFGGAIDGIEVMAVLFAKRIGVTVGTFVMVYNTVLYVISGFILSSWTLPLYSIVAYTVALKTVDFIVEGIDKAKAAIIITEKQDKISAALSKSFGNGITMIPAKGYYSDANKTVIYFVLNRFQIGRMRNIVLSNDSNAFISIVEISEIMKGGQ